MIDTFQRCSIFCWCRNNTIHWKLDLADTDLAENLGLKDTLQKIWSTIFYFQYISPLEIAENLVLADKSLVTDFSAKSSFHCTLFYAATMGLSGIELYLVKTISLQFDWTKIYEKGLDSCYIEVMYKGGINVWMTEWFFFTVELNTFTLYCQSVPYTY